MQQDSINYSALSEKPTRDEIKQFKRNHATYVESSYKITLVVVLAMIVGFVGVASISEQRGGSVGLMVAGMLVVIFGGTGVLFYLAHRSKLRKQTRLYKFAQENGIQAGFNKPGPAYPGMIFDNGHSRVLKEVIRFNDGLELGNYMYKTGRGRSQREFYWGYARIQLSRRLPHMVLDAKKNNFLSRFTNLPDGFKKDQTLRLEGNFNDFFTLYVPKEYERDALYVFTPDVMAALIDFGAQYDVEVIDDSIFLYTTNHLPVYSAEYLKRLLTVTDKIGTELHDQSRRYADERIGDKTANIVANPGRRLKSGIKAGTVIAVAIVILWIFFTNVDVLRLIP